MNKDYLDPSLTFWQVLLIIARKLIQWPTSQLEISYLIDGLKKTKQAIFEVTWLLISPVMRVVLLLTLPLSAPIVAFIVQREARRIALARAKFRANLHKNGSTILENDEDTEHG